MLFGPKRKLCKSTSFPQNERRTALQKRPSYFLFSTDETLKFLKFGICSESIEDRSYCLGSVKGQLCFLVHPKAQSYCLKS